MSRSQLARDLAALCAMAGLVVTYHLALRHYLAALDRPMLFEIGFLMTFGIALLHEMKGGFRAALAGGVVTAVVFVVGVLASIWFREEYMQLMAQVRDVQLTDLLGQDVAEALANRAVGYGGSFAVGLLAARLTIGSSAVRRWMVSRLLGPAGLHHVCPCCGQPVARTV